MTGKRKETFEKPKSKRQKTVLSFFSSGRKTSASNSSNSSNSSSAASNSSNASSSASNSFNSSSSASNSSNSSSSSTPSSKNKKKGGAQKETNNKQEALKNYKKKFPQFGGYFQFKNNCVGCNLCGASFWKGKQVRATTLSQHVKTYHASEKPREPKAQSIASKTLKQVNLF